MPTIAIALKRRFYLVHLGFFAVFAVAAVVSFKTLPRIERVALAGVPGAQIEDEPVERDFSAAPDLFGTTTLPVATGTCDDAPPTTLRLRLVSSLVSPVESLSLASIADGVRRGPVKIYSINACDCAGCNRIGDSAVLLRIEPTRVCIWNLRDGRVELLSLHAGAAASVATTSSFSGIERTGSTSFRVRRGEVIAMLSLAPSELAIPASIVSRGGRPIGVRLHVVRPGSIYERVGFQSGDVIETLNGEAVTDPTKGVSLYSKLKEAEHIRVDVRRGGKLVTLAYELF